MSDFQTGRCRSSDKVFTSYLRRVLAILVQIAVGALMLLPGIYFPSSAQSSQVLPDQSPASENAKTQEPEAIPVKACAFDPATQSFSGTPLEQATCLLRPVMIYGRLDDALKRLPEPLETLIGQPVGIDKEGLRRYLRKNKIKEEDLGGSLDEPVSKGRDNSPDAPFASYFVIHDVSTPNYLNESWPANINEKGWEWNDLQNRWLNNKVAHIFINRVGESVTAVEFKTAWRATKLEVKVLRETSKGSFLHTELVQPRRRDPKGSPNNDAIAPVPGFTEAQLDRLALVYLAASLRRGVWMIPAFHAAVDAGIPEAHDDPQNFDLPLWAKRLAKLLREVQPTTASQSK
jgi:hypothetical protein